MSCQHVAWSSCNHSCWCGVYDSQLYCYVHSSRKVTVNIRSLSHQLVTVFCFLVCCLLLHQSIQLCNIWLSTLPPFCKSAQPFPIRCHGLLYFSVPARLRRGQWERAVGRVVCHRRLRLGGGTHVEYVSTADERGLARVRLGSEYLLFSLARWSSVQNVHGRRVLRTHV